ncbi:hypothetical protein AA637_11790 [Cyanobacterium sp. HL-69]|uniref:hypothetical protein n=1 Tax=Cyanobacterium sp. HL-69 TaxID=2054282 RepID=UPI000CA2D0D4|nr:hypothetical protein AA637_11790 [Cyanobacterium sp. HL-69]
MAHLKSKIIKQQTTVDPTLIASIPAWALKDKTTEIESDQRTILEKYGYQGNGKK